MTVGRIPSVEGGIQPTLLDAKADLITATANDTPARLGVGANGTVLTADSATATGLKWAAPAGGGKVLQVVQGTTSTTASNSTTTAADTNLTATITPTLSTSKILVLVSQQGVFKSSGNAQNSVNLRLMRGATEIQKIATNVFYTNTTVDFVGSISSAYLDTPSTTSATTYKTQFYNYVGAASVSVQIQGTDLSTITLLEIGA